MLATLAAPVATANAQQVRAQIVVHAGFGDGGQYGSYRNGPPPPWSNDRYRGDRRSDIAVTNGYNDGYREGLNDGRHRHRNDPYAESRYRSGDHGYERWYGDRNSYRYSYRDAFRRGYERGYTDGWRRR